MFIFDFFRKKKKLDAPWEKYFTKKELNIKIPDISMYEQIFISTKKYPKNTAIKYMGKKINYNKFLKKIDIVSKGFYDLGIKKGDIVTILLPNVPEALISLYALNKIGAIANMTHPLSSKEEIKETLISTNSKFLIIYNELYYQIEDFIYDLGMKKVIFVNVTDSLNISKKIIYNLRRINKYKRYPKNNLFISYSKFLMKSKFKKDFNRIKFGKNTPAVILHSGGTSGSPKNVVIQNRAFIYASIAEPILLKKLNVGDSALAIMPNFHGFGLSVLMHTPLAIGCSSILVPKFNAKKFDVLLKKTKPTCILGVPTLYEGLINSNNIKKLDLSFLKYVVSGGDILNKVLEEKINSYLKSHNSNAIITQGYGLSEALACVSLASDNINKSGSVGVPLPGNNVKIINSYTRKKVKANEVGEIVINSKALMMGYLNNEVETNASLQMHLDGHIWLHTGDLGFIDEDGFLYYKGRLKRMIITSGYNVYPSYIEEVIEKHPSVLQCTVVGVPHPYKQEVPKAFIVLKDGFHVPFIKTEIKKYASERLAKYMVPYEIVIRKKLPKTKLGKIDFNKLKEDYGEDEY